MTEPLPDFAAEWMVQWKRAANELAEIRDAALRELSPSDSLEAMSLLDVSASPPCRPLDPGDSHDNNPHDKNPHENGLVIQQKWFMRLRLLQSAREEYRSGGLTQTSPSGD